MKEIPPAPTKESIKDVIVRAKLVERRCKACPEEPKQVRRSDIRKTETVARGLLGYTREGACATLARDVLQIATTIDNIMAEIYPVFEMVDEKLRAQGCKLQWNEMGYWLLDGRGEILSSGPTFRDWLIDHAKRFGDPLTFVYDRTSE